MGIVDSKIESYIFYPPKRTESIEEIKKIGKVFKLKTISEETVYMTMIFPKRYSSTYKYILFSYGNATDMYEMIQYAQLVADQNQTIVILYDYVGYGFSTGTPSEQGCYESLDAVIDFLIYKLRITHTDVILVGQSLGTGVVVNNIAKDIFWDSPIILISPYKSMGKVAADHSSFFSYCRPFFSPIDKFKSYEKIKNINCPVKIYHGLNDAVIDISHGIGLYNSLQNKVFLPSWLNGVGHNNILPEIDYRELLEYIKQN